MKMKSQVEMKPRLFFDARRLVTLTVVIGAGLSCAFLVPSDAVLRNAAIRMDGSEPWLPETIGGAEGKKLEPSELELEWLATDTRFAKRTYGVWGGLRSWDDISVNIVLSGQDMNQSIHRPERCLPSQGHKNLEISDRTLDVESRRRIEVKQIVSTMVLGEGESEVKVRHLHYYWFIGYDGMTSSHYERTLLDIKSRLLGGFNQRWAYFAISGIVSGDLLPDGRSLDETARQLEEVARGVFNGSVVADQLK
jgi:hypothetical protein